MAKRRDDEVVAATYEAAATPDDSNDDATMFGRDAVHDGTLDVRVEGRGAPVENPKPTYEELVAKIETETKARQEAEARANPVAAMQPILERLSAPAPAPSVPIQQQPSESDEAFSERLKKDFFESPRSHLDEWGRRTIAPVVGQVSSAIQALAREMMELHPEHGAAFRKYASEVDAVVAGRPDRYMNPRVYREVFEQVQARHINEIVAERVKAELEKVGSEPPGRTFTERPGGTPSTARRPQVVSLTRAEAKEAMALGLDHETYYRQKHNKW